jgi:hypothetical protein
MLLRVLALAVALLASALAADANNFAYLTTYAQESDIGGEQLLGKPLNTTQACLDASSLSLAQVCGSYCNR